MKKLTRQLHGVREDENITYTFLLSEKDPADMLLEDELRGVVEKMQADLKIKWDTVMGLTAKSEDEECGVTMEDTDEGLLITFTQDDVREIIPRFRSLIHFQLLPIRNKADNAGIQGAIAGGMLRDLIMGTPAELKLIQFLLDSPQTTDLLRRWAESAGHGYPDELPLVSHLKSKVEKVLKALVPNENDRKLSITEILEV
jgi:hypothetical protein